MSTHLPILRRLVRWWGSEAVIEPTEECRHVNTPANGFSVPPAYLIFDRATSWLYVSAINWTFRVELRGQIVFHSSQQQVVYCSIFWDCIAAL